MEIQNDIEAINNEIDKGKVLTKRVEHFIDKYIPIRIQQLINDTLYGINLSRSQQQRLQNYEMEKFKKLNEDLLDDETHPELLDLMRSIALEMEAAVVEYKKIAKARGQRYEIKKPGKSKGQTERDRTTGKSLTADRQSQNSSSKDVTSLSANINRHKPSTKPSIVTEEQDANSQEQTSDRDQSTDRLSRQIKIQDGLSRNNQVPVSASDAKRAEMNFVEEEDEEE